jgi:hypothetical protein
LVAAQAKGTDELTFLPGYCPLQRIKTLSDHRFFQRLQIFAAAPDDSTDERFFPHVQIF